MSESMSYLLTFLEVLSEVIEVLLEREVHPDQATSDHHTAHGQYEHDDRHTHATTLAVPGSGGK